MEENGGISSFASDISSSLSAPIKFIDAKYMYDDIGSKFFQGKMSQENYYLTNCEMEIMKSQSLDILAQLGFSTGKFKIIELGSGDGLKTLEMLRIFLSAGAEFSYIPVDISSKALRHLETRMRSALPSLSLRPECADYFEALEKITKSEECPALFLFMGANIGNFKESGAVEFLKSVSGFMKKGDKILLGFDLKKSPALIVSAYNDSTGLSDSFVLNPLDRVRKELDADVDLKNFQYYSSYNPQSGEIRGYLISLVEQTFFSKVLQKKFELEKFEAIEIYSAKKYTVREIRALAEKAGFTFIRNFIDSKNYIADSLWEK